METFDFDTPVDRRGTDCLKYDFATEHRKPADVLPLWVADMDFPAPPAVNRALAKAVQDGIYGYSDTKQDYADAVLGWFSRRHGWQANADWIVKTPGVVFALAMAVRALSEPGDAVLLQPPVYYPFYSVIRSNRRRIAENPLRLRQGRYEMDFDDFENKIVSEKVKVFLLCSPHNPVGRVWTKEELRRIGEICERHGVYVVADEIHCDITLPGHAHTMFLAANPSLFPLTVLCTAPSKTFNLAGLQVSNCFIPDPAVRAKFRKEVNKTGYSQLNMMGLIACKAAYREGDAWFSACLDYLKGNLDFIRSFVEQHIPRVRLIEPEGTYFAWLDFSALGLDDAQLDDLVTNRARLWLDAGYIFGREAGSGFQRIAYACQRQTLIKAMGALRDAINAL